MAQRRSTHRGAKGAKGKAPAARKTGGMVTHGDKLAHAASSRSTAASPSGKNPAAGTPNGKPGTGKSGKKTGVTEVEKAVVQPTGFLARARKAVGNVVKRVTAGRKPGAAAASTADARKPGKRTG